MNRATQQAENYAHIAATLAHLILTTPTGNVRNHLCDAAIACNEMLNTLAYNKRVMQRHYERAVAQLDQRN